MVIYLFLHWALTSHYMAHTVYSLRAERKNVFWALFCHHYSCCHLDFSKKEKQTTDEQHKARTSRAIRPKRSKHCSPWWLHPGGTKATSMGTIPQKRKNRAELRERNEKSVCGSAEIPSTLNMPLLDQYAKKAATYWHNWIQIFFLYAGSLL